jgi:CBS domain-containing protein
MAERSLRDLFHLIKQVLPEEQEVVTCSPDTPVAQVLQIMREGNFSAIPVVAGNEILGAFSYRSFAEGLVRLTKKEREPLVLPVEEFLEDLQFAQITDELTVLLDEFDLKDTVLVGSENRLQGIITTIDALRYFYRVASPYVLLREIELALRELIRASATEQELGECIEKTLKNKYEENNQTPPTSLQELTFNDYVMLLRHQATWAKFKPAMGGTSHTVYAKLQPLPGLRNDVFHFRRELTAEEYDILRDRRDWLLKRIRVLEALKK